MTNIDRQRFTAVRLLESMGYVFRDEWMAPSMGWPAPAAAEADAMHTLLVLRADQLDGCTEGSPEAAELHAITDALEGYEAKRWPDGKAPNGKG